MQNLIFPEQENTLHIKLLGKEMLYSLFGVHTNKNYQVRFQIKNIYSGTKG